MRDSLFKYSALQCNDHGVGAIAGSEFGENTLHVPLDSMYREIEVIRDDLIGIASSNGMQHIQLANGQGIFSCVFGHCGCNLWWYLPLASVNQTDGVDQIRTHHTLQQITAGSGFERLQG